MKKIYFLIFLLLGCFLITDVEAQEDLELSRAYNESGMRLFNEGRFLEAAAEFEKAWNTYPKVEAVFNIAFAYDKAGILEKAVFWYKEYLKAAPENEKKKIEEKIKELEAEIDKKTFDKKEEVAIEKKGEKDAAQIITQKPKEKSFGYNLWKWVAAGGAVTFLGFGLAFNSLAIGGAEEANKLPLYNEGDWKKYRLKFQSAKSQMTISYVFYGLSAAAALASGILWYFDYQEDKKKNFPAINILPTKETDGAMIFISF
jgi:tetratricopeptide (TPR) repeat protein